ncbi:MAG TPA: helix-turn-helix domain-containing protein [Gemmataceae bacterium]|nr:helix-turn-helix domain-containing protein [Gemmataceae bacterium]
MVVRRIYRKTERTPEEKARLQAIREKFQKEKPSLEDLLANGDYDGPVPQGAYLELRTLMHILRTAREQQGLSLPAIAERTEIDEAILDQLETGKKINPTIDLLWRYAHAVGKQLAWTVIEGTTPPGPKADGHSRTKAPRKSRKS